MSCRRPMRVVLALALWFVCSCSPARRASLGAECELNSECDSPLICRIGFCRNECATSADCPAGLSCLLDAQRLGVCQLAEEASCTLASECTAPLVCRFNQCTNPCTEDRDCLGGARCRVDPAGNACIDPSSSPCAFDGECDVAGGEFCLFGRCRQQCFTDRDCRRGFRCNTTGFLGRCEDPRFDAGPRDTPMADAPLDVPTRDAAGSPCLVGPLVGVRSFALGGNFGCAITNDGTSHLFCWGDNTEGARGTLASSLCATEVMPLRGLDLQQVAASTRTTCVRVAGEILCMGSNNYGALGRDMPAGMGGTVMDEVPRPVAGGLRAMGLTGGSTSRRFFANEAGTGALFGWGAASSGELDGVTGADRGTPIRATRFTAATMLATGDAVACGALAGTPTCYGFGGDGALGDGGGMSIVGTTAMAVGGRFACAADATRVYCWGSNIAGQLGDGTTIPRSMRLPTMPMPRPARALAASYGHACAILDDDALWCWGGRRAFDPMGPEEPTAPMPIANGVTAVDCGDDSTCILQAGRLLCTGRVGAALGVGISGLPDGFMEVVQ